MFLSFALVIVFVVATFAKKDELQRVSDKLLTRKFFRNEKWASVRPSLRTNSVVSSTDDSAVTLFAYEYLNSKSCSAEKADIAAGNAFNTCIVGLSENGEVLGSGIYRLVDGFSSNKFIEAVYSEYPTADCTGTPTLQETENYPKYCFTDDTSSTSVRFLLVKNSDFQTELKNGLLYSYFDTQENCAKTSPVANSLTWVGFGTCIATDDGKSVKYTDCANGQPNVEVYSDSQCASVVQKSPIPLPTCQAYEQYSPSTDSGFYYRSYVTEACL